MSTSQSVQEKVHSPFAAQRPSEGRIPHLNKLGRQASVVVFAESAQEDVDRIVEPMVLAGFEHVQHFALLAVEETKTGVMGDTVIENMVAPLTSVESAIAAGSPDTEKKVLTELSAKRPLRK